LRALHVNHGLSANARTWERFCALHCKRRGVAFESVQLPSLGKRRNVEAWAREARYRAFAERGSEIVALAHNLDDQAETVLLQLLRGSGVRGLAAMPPIRGLPPRGAMASRQRLIRPLLQATRPQIVAYARRHRLSWMEDESNQDDRYARNFLRLRVLPVLEHRFPGCRAALSRAASHLQDADALLQEIGRLDYETARTQAGLNVDGLESLSPSRAANALRIYLAECGESPPSSLRIAEALRQLRSARRDATPSIELARGVLRRYRGVISWQAHGAIPALPACETSAWNGEPRVALRDGGALVSVKTRGAGVDAARLRESDVTVRTRRGGESIRLAPGRPRRTLKNLLQEAGIPPWQRNRMPLLFCGEQLVWAPGVGVAAEFAARPGKASWRFSWRPPQDPEVGS